MENYISGFSENNYQKEIQTNPLNLIDQLKGIVILIKCITFFLLCSRLPHNFYNALIDRAIERLHRNH
jgi:hypothetical protein